MRNSPLLSVLLLLGSFAGHAQSPTTELGFGPALSFYGGDLSGLQFDDYFDNINVGATVFVRQPLAGPFDWRLGFSVLPLSGDDAQEGRLRNLNFTNDLLELSAVIDWRMFALRTGNGPVVFYLFGGAAGYYHNPKTNFQGTQVALQPLGTEGQGTNGLGRRYTKFQLAVPAGGGIKLPVGPNWAIQGEFGGRITFTDYLDDVGAADVTYDEVLAGNGPLAAALYNREYELSGEEPGGPLSNSDRLRGNEVRDYYYAGTVTLIYRFGGAYGNRNARCPTF